ncbi:MAG: hypothetical protein AB8C46_23090 [Burkholderiaceae bacterium]
MKYAFVDDHQTQFKIQMMCQTLSVSRSGYYLWRRGRDKISVNKQRARARDQAIASLFDKRKGRYGSPRIARDLRQAV